MSDPLGKRALFSATAGAPTVSNGRPATTGTISKESLFSASEGERRFGTVVVGCSACGARTRLNWPEFFWRHLPVGAWLPWLRYSQYMSCPACERRTWLGAGWFA